MKRLATLTSRVTFLRQFPAPIRTQRLELRPFHEGDIDSIATLLSDPEATRFIGSTKSREVAADSVRLMRDAFASRGWGTLAVTELNGKSCIGYCGVRPLLHTPEVEIAFALQREHWNRGFATEAACAALDAAFQCLPVGSIVATVYPDNKASIRVLEKLGMVIEGEVFGQWPLSTALLYRISRDSKTLASDWT